jgi:2-polyprenyl-6-methoxyphenol hydroxylase-like FAD-dependent oxidoreductase
MVESRKALVVGAGPAGLSAAISLRKAGFAVDVLERTPDRAVLGSELLVASPALRALDLIGAAERVTEVGVPIEGLSFFAQNGTPVATIPFHKITRPELPSSVGITRSALHAAIYDSAEGLDIKVSHNVSVQGLVNEGAGIRATRTDGIECYYDFVVGADGVASQVRELRFPETSKPPYSGQCVWRASVPRTTEGALYAGFGRKANVGLITVSKDESYLFCLMAYASPPRPDPAHYVDLIHDALSEFEGPFGDARRLIDGSRTIHFSPMWAGVMPLPWTDGRAILIGDAAHATTPHLGYGAGLAIEDGIVLGWVMRDAPNVATGLRTFGERRLERSRMVVETGLRICKSQQSPIPGFNQAAESEAVWVKLTEPI